MGMWVEPTMMPGLVSSLERDGVRRRALVFAGARGIPFASHHAIRRSIACWVVAAQSAAEAPMATMVMSSAKRMGSTWATVRSSPITGSM